MKSCHWVLFKQKLTAWFNVPLDTLLVPIPFVDILLDIVLFRLAATRFEFIFCRLLAIGLYECELWDLKPTNETNVDGEKKQIRKKSGKKWNTFVWRPWHQRLCTMSAKMGQFTRQLRNHPYGFNEQSHVSFFITKVVS